MLIVGVLLMSLSTFDVSIGLMHCIQAFIFYTGPGGSDARFTGLTDWVNVLKSCNIVFGKLISDGILVYRCWIVCNRSMLVIAFPLLLWLGYFGNSIYGIYLEASAGKPKVLLTDGMEKLHNAIIIGWTMSLANNIITTGLIVYRIWRVDRSNTKYGVKRSRETTREDGVRHLFGGKTCRTELQNVIRIIIESGLMYTTIALITFVTFETGSNSFYPTSDAELQILSIAFNLIIIRISTHPSGPENYSTNIQSVSSERSSFTLRKIRFAVKDTASTFSSTQMDSASVSSKVPRLSEVKEGNMEDRDRRIRA